MESLGTGAGRELRGLRSFSDSARTEAGRGLRALRSFSDSARTEAGNGGWKGARWAHPERGESFIIIFYQFINNLKFKKIMAINLKAKETLIQVG